MKKIDKFEKKIFRQEEERNLTEYNKKKKSQSGSGKSLELGDSGLAMIAHKESRHKAEAEQLELDYVKLESNQNMSNTLGEIRWKKLTCLTFLITLKEEDKLPTQKEYWNKAIENASDKNAELARRFEEMDMVLDQELCIKEESEDAPEAVMDGGGAEKQEFKQMEELFEG